MSPVLEQPTTRRRRRRALPRSRALVRAGALLTATALGAVGMVLPAEASTGTANDGATATGPDTVVVGQSIHLEGEGWVAPAAAGGGGSVIGVKLDDSNLTTQPPPTNPVNNQPVTIVWGLVKADSDGSWTADLPFPTTANADPASGFDASSWVAGTSHNVRLLTGSLLPGDQPRTVSLPFQVVQAAANATVAATASNGGRGADPAQVNLSVSGQGFTPAASTTVTVDATAATWSTAPTVAADGTFSGGRIVYAPGALRAGSHTVSVSDGTHTADTTVSTTPALSWSGLTAGSDGVLTLANLPTGATLPALSLGDVQFDLSSATTADDGGKATVGYSIPSDAALGTQTLTITQANPSATYTASVKISPSSATFGEDDYTVVTSPDALQQGLYQSAYGAKTDSVFATSANVTTTSTIYKLDPDTLAVRDSVVPAYVSGDSGPLYAAYGVGVDDVHGYVWVTQTRQNSVAVYRQDDLSLVKQFPASTVSHSRDVIYDPATDRVFVSSASEGSSGDGYVSVFDGSSLEKITDVQTGPRTGFSPMSLTLDPKTDTVYTVSSTSSKLGRIDAKTLGFSTVDLAGLPAGARASGVAVDPVGKRVYVASQNVDGLLVANLTSGATIATVPTGAGALNVAFDPVNKLVYVANFGGTTISVASATGTLLANLPFARPNHVAANGKGAVYAVNKDTPNTVIRITPVGVNGTTPQISGTPAVGRKLTAVPGTWTPGTKLSYQWQRNGTAIKGATKKVYPVVAADKGKQLTVTVTGTLKGHPSVSLTSDAVTVGTGKLASSKPTIAGTPKVGKTLTAVPGSWTAGTAFSYTWYANGKLLNGQTAKTLRLPASLAGKKVAVKVTGVLKGYTTVTRTSAVVVVKR
ncbi:hypothetical protein [Nostocoides japonicum]|uniref:hypothetical protein n=1 Tax=Nostocoides japonicum TaxID=99481 RepID=UPI000A4CB6F9|nr:hypothetical protein [Tetrasphaera japonica]